MVALGFKADGIIDFGVMGLDERMGDVRIVGMIGDMDKAVIVPEEVIGQSGDFVDFALLDAKVRGKGREEGDETNVFHEQFLHAGADGKQILFGFGLEVIEAFQHPEIVLDFARKGGGEIVIEVIELRRFLAIDRFELGLSKNRGEDILGVEGGIGMVFEILF